MNDRAANPANTKNRRPNRRSPKAPATSGFAARKAATEILNAVLAEGASLDDAFAAAISGGTLKGVEGRDRALTRLIVATSLRRLPEIETIIAKFVKKKLGAKTGLVREILITGAAQMMFLDIAPHAVVNVATSLASADRHGRHFKGLVNAVLRNISKSEEAPLQGEAAVKMNLPPWLLTSWVKAYGEADALAAASLLFEDPPLDLTTKSDPQKWGEALGGAVLENGTVRLNKPGRVEALAGFEDGDWWVQDAAASLPARLLAAKSGKNIIDLCAAPGGKTAQLALTGAKVTAVERNPERAKRLGANLTRLGFKAEIVVDDAALWRPETRADGVLLDAPCSATGIFRRHPDSLRRRGQSQVAKLAKLQAELIDASLAMLNPGGTLVYCTCSLEVAEGEAQIDAALARHSNLEVIPIAPGEVPGFAKSVTDQGYLRVLPHHLSAPARPDLAEITPESDQNSESKGGWPAGGSDGFFAAKLRLS